MTIQDCISADPKPLVFTGVRAEQLMKVLYEAEQLGRLNTGRKPDMKLVDLGPSGGDLA